MPGSTFRRPSWTTFLAAVPWRSRTARHEAAALPVPDELPAGRLAARASTQEAFGRIMGELGQQRPAAGRAAGDHLARRHRLDQSRCVGHPPRRVQPHATTRTCSAPSRSPRPPSGARAGTGQHIELGIAENNLFLNLAALGLGHELFGARLLPVGTLYDPFINRGLDALIYACYQGARFLLVATPSGTALAPEGGAHQSIGTPLIGMSQPGLTCSSRPSPTSLPWSCAGRFEHMQARGRRLGLPAADHPADRPAASAAIDERAGSAASSPAAIGWRSRGPMPTSPSSSAAPWRPRSWRRRQSWPTTCRASAC